MYPYTLLFMQWIYISIYIGWLEHRGKRHYESLFLHFNCYEYFLYLLGREAFNWLSECSVPAILKYFPTTFLNNCGRGESLVTTTCHVTVAWCEQGHAPCKMLLLKHGEHRAVSKMRQNLATLSFPDIAEFKIVVSVYMFMFQEFSKIFVIAYVYVFVPANKCATEIFSK